MIPNIISNGSVMPQDPVLIVVVSIYQEADTKTKDDSTSFCTVAAWMVVLYYVTLLHLSPALRWYLLLEPSWPQGEREKIRCHDNQIAGQFEIISLLRTLTLRFLTYYYLLALFLKT